MIKIKIIMLLMLLNSNGHVTVGSGGEFDSEEVCQSAVAELFDKLPPEADAGRIIAACVEATFDPKPEKNS